MPIDLEAARTFVYGNGRLLDQLSFGAAFERGDPQEASYFQAHPDAVDYGFGPLDFSPTPTSLASAWFEGDLLEQHLDQLEHQQQGDGGWPIAWEPPSPASTCEWRAIRSVQALRTLAAYSRIVQLR